MKKSNLNLIQKIIALNERAEKKHFLGKVPPNVKFKPASFPGLLRPKFAGAEEASGNSRLSQRLHEKQNPFRAPVAHYEVRAPYSGPRFQRQEDGLSKRARAALKAEQLLDHEEARQYHSDRRLDESHRAARLGLESRVPLRETVGDEEPKQETPRADSPGEQTHPRTGRRDSVTAKPGEQLDSDQQKHRKLLLLTEVGLPVVEPEELQPAQRAEQGEVGSEFALI